MQVEFKDVYKLLKQDLDYYTREINRRCAKCVNNDQELKFREIWFCISRVRSARLKWLWSVWIWN